MTSDRHTKSTGTWRAFACLHIVSALLQHLAQNLYAYARIINAVEIVTKLKFSNHRFFLNNEKYNGYNLMKIIIQEFLNVRALHFINFTSQLFKFCQFTTRHLTQVVDSGMVINLRGLNLAPKGTMVSQVSSETSPASVKNVSGT